MLQKAVQAQVKANMNEDKIWSKDFVLILFANFFVFLGFQMVLPTLPLYIKELGGNDTIVGLIVGVFAFSALIIRPWSGNALERWGRRGVYLTGLAIFAISVGSYAVISSIFFLFMLRIIQGVGWGMSTTASGTIATDIIPPRRRGEGLGYYGLSGNLALAIGPSLGLLMVGLTNFRTLFLISALLGILALLSAYIVRFQPMTSVPVNSSRGFQWEKIYEKSALIPSILLFFVTITVGGIASFLPIYAKQKGIEGIELYFILYALALMVTRPLSGKLFDQKGHRLVFIPGAIMIILAMLLLSVMVNSTMMLGAALLYGAGFGAVQPALQAWAVQKSPPNRRGMANATFFSFFDFGVGIGAILFGLISAWVGYAGIYIASAVSAVISLVLYLYFTKPFSSKTKAAA